MEAIHKITVVGGGTAGCISALILKKRFPQCIVELIESKSIGIVGVGEGSTEHWIEFCKFVGINFFEVIEKCGATFKVGIYYDKWSKTPFMHSIIKDKNFISSGYFYSYAHMISKNISKQFMQPKYTWENKFPLEHIKYPDLIPTNQFHFDTFKLNNFLHKKCEEMSIDLIEDEIININFDSNQKINFIESNTKKYYSNFYIDCSGFKRLILQKSMDVKWISYSQYLPLNSAIAFPTEEIEEYKTYTTATAHKFGWGWTIPVQGRTGNGYVFCDSFITKEKAHEEMETFHEKKIEIFKQFKFDPGRLEKFWHKNCVSIGLASNFVEPLEATSIGSTIQQVFCLMNFLPSYDEKTYNKIMINLFDNIVDYIQAHYLTKREDTEFWREIKNNLKITDSLKENLSVWKNRLPRKTDFSVPWGMFDAENYIQILHGLDWFDVEMIKKEYCMFNNREIAEDNFHKIIHYENNLKVISHKKIIKSILTMFE